MSGPQTLPATVQPAEQNVRSELSTLAVVVEKVDVSRLRPIGERPPLGEYVRQLWQRRHFIWADSRLRAFSGHRDTVLGRFWLVGQPLLDGLAFFLIFGLVLGTRVGVTNFIAFLLVGTFMFSYSMRCLNQGAGAMQAGRSLVRAFSFPRASIPLAVFVRESLSMVPVIVTMLVMILAIPPHAQVTWRWLLFPLVLLLQGLFNLGLVLYAARFTFAVPDLRLVLGVFSRFWMYGSGVMFSLERFVTHPTLLSVLQLNPVYCVLEISRDLLVYGTNPDPRLWLTLGMWALVTPVLGFVYFWHAERSYARE